MTLYELSQINNSLKRAKKITGLKFADIRNLIRLSASIAPEIDFLNLQELEIFNKYADKDEFGSPVKIGEEIKISGEEKIDKAKKDLIELRSVDTKFDFEHFSIFLKELDNELPISANDLEILSKFITFDGD